MPKHAGGDGDDFTRRLRSREGQIASGVQTARHKRRLDSRHVPRSRLGQEGNHRVTRRGSIMKFGDNLTFRWANGDYFLGSICIDLDDRVLAQDVDSDLVRYAKTGGKPTGITASYFALSCAGEDGSAYGFRLDDPKYFRKVDSAGNHVYSVLNGATVGGGGTNPQNVVYMESSDSVIYPAAHIDPLGNQTSALIRRRGTDGTLTARTHLGFRTAHREGYTVPTMTSLSGDTLCFGFANGAVGDLFSDPGTVWRWSPDFSDGNYADIDAAGLIWSHDADDLISGIAALVDGGCAYVTQQNAFIVSDGFTGDRGTLVRLTSDGTMLWSVSPAANERIVSGAICAGPTDSITILTEVVTDIVITGLTATYVIEIWLTKFDSNGVLLRKKRISTTRSSAGNKAGALLRADATGNVYVGKINGTWVFG